MWILNLLFFLKNTEIIYNSRIKNFITRLCCRFSSNELGEKLVQILSNQKKKIVFAESCTGGFLSSLITEVAGASQVFQAGYVVYQKEEKISFQKNLGVLKKIFP